MKALLIGSIADPTLLFATLCILLIISFGLISAGLTTKDGALGLVVIIIGGLLLLAITINTTILIQTHIDNIPPTSQTEQHLPFSAWKDAALEDEQEACQRWIAEGYPRAIARLNAIEAEQYIRRAKADEAAESEVK
jgi:hypothetical protein